ncbi:hypothetical protein ACWIGW_16780 [Nocardia brasiliensis]
MPDAVQIPLGIKLTADIEKLDRRRSSKTFRARVRWTNPLTKQRDSKSEAFETEDLAQAWIDQMKELARRGLDPIRANVTLLDYGEANMALALTGLEPKTTDPYLCGWRKRVKPTLGHLLVPTITNGIIDRAVVQWIEEDSCSRSTIKNTLGVLVRVMEQARRDGLIALNPARVRGWQASYKQIEDELEDPRALALPTWQTLIDLCEALVAASHGNYRVWGNAVMFAACTAARIGEVSGCRIRDIDTQTWIWTVRRQTTPGPGGLTDKGTKGKHDRLKSASTSDAYIRTAPEADQIHARTGAPQLPGLSCSAPAGALPNDSGLHQALSHSEQSAGEAAIEQRGQDGLLKIQRTTLNLVLSSQIFKQYSGIATDFALDSSLRIPDRQLAELPNSDIVHRCTVRVTADPILDSRKCQIGAQI